VKYLFITGCARSGTSALAQLIGSHGSIVMGMERFGHLVSHTNFTLTPEHFLPERFLDIRPEDTFYSNFSDFHCWDEFIYDKLNDNNLSYIGDKRPNIHLSYDQLFSRFPDALLIYIYRDIYDVAASWNKRAREKCDWSVSDNYKKAVHVWNQSLKYTKHALSKYPENIICVRYENAFIHMHDLLALYRKLNLDIDASSQEKLHEIQSISNVLKFKRNDHALSEKEISYCSKHASFSLEKELDQINLI